MKNRMLKIPKQMNNNHNNKHYRNLGALVLLFRNILNDHFYSRKENLT